VSGFLKIVSVTKITTRVSTVLSADNMQGTPKQVTRRRQKMPSTWRCLPIIINQKSWESIKLQGRGRHQTVERMIAAMLRHTE